MQATNPTSTTRSTSSDQAAIVVSLELSRAVWLVTALLPGSTQRPNMRDVALKYEEQQAKTVVFRARDLLV
jgi:hypothetical protein